MPNAAVISIVFMSLPRQASPAPRRIDDFAFDPAPVSSSRPRDRPQARERVHRTSLALVNMAMIDSQYGRY
jgi:hypothetical protein